MINYRTVIYMKRKICSSALLLSATIIWGYAFVAQRSGMEHIGPFTFQAIRCLLAVIGLIPVVAIFDAFKKDNRNFFSRWADRKLWIAGILCGIPLFLACNLQQLALVDVDAGKSGFLTAMYIVFVPLIGIFLRKKPSVLIPFSIILAVAGLYFLCGQNGLDIQVGDLLLLGCAVMFAIQITVVDIFVQSVDPLRLNTIQSLVCAVLSCVAMIFTEQPNWQGIFNCAVPLCYAGFLSMGIGYALQIIGQRHLESTAASLIMSLESVFAALCGAWILKETMTSREILGCVLVFAGVILSQIPAPSFGKKK